MRLDGIASDVLLEMAYTRKRAETIIGGLEYQLNLHLLKLAAVPMPEHFVHWRHELTTWLATIAAIRLKPSNKPGPARWYLSLLFEEPFGGNEAEAVLARLQLLRQQYGTIRDDANPAELAERLRRFHIAFSNGCEATMNLNQINDLIAALLGRADSRTR